jgi:chitinase
MGYYAMWERLDPTPDNFPYEKLTHVLIGNLVPSAGGGCCSIPWDSSFQQPWEQFERDVIANAKPKGTKVLLMLGGAGGNPNSVWNSSTSSANVARFAQSIVNYAKPRGYAGIDIDWEEELDGNGVTRLAKELRARWPEAVLTFAAAPLNNDIGWMRDAHPYLDRINGMTYMAIGDWGGWDGPWYMAPIYDYDDGNPSNGVRPYSLDRFVRNVKAQGVPAGKIAIGLGFHALCSGGPGGPEGPMDGFGGDYFIGDPFLTLPYVEQYYAPYMRRVWDDQAKVPYLTAPSPGAGGTNATAPALGRCTYITYEDTQSITEKGKWVRANGLGGTIIWTVPEGIRPNGSSPWLDAVAASF